MIENEYINISKLCEKYRYDMDEWFEQEYIRIISDF